VPDSKWRFREQVRTDPVVAAVLVGFAAFEIYFTVFSWHALRSVGILHLVVAGLLVFVAISFRALAITVNEKTVTFGFGPFRKRVNLSDIVSVVVTDAGLLTTGIGIHIIRDGYWAWVARRGAAVRVTLGGRKTGGYVLSTDRPRDLIAALMPTADDGNHDDSYYAT
jgi:hypothetical protein